MALSVLCADGEGTVPRSKRFRDFHSLAHIDKEGWVLHVLQVWHTLTYDACCLTNAGRGADDGRGMGR